MADIINYSPANEPDELKRLLMALTGQAMPVPMPPSPPLGPLTNQIVAENKKLPPEEDISPGAESTASADMISKLSKPETLQMPSGQMPQAQVEKQVPPQRQTGADQLKKILYAIIGEGPQSAADLRRAAESGIGQALVSGRIKNEYGNPLEAQLKEFELNKQMELQGPMRGLEIAQKMLGINKSAREEQDIANQRAEGSPETLAVRDMMTKMGSPPDVVKKATGAILKDVSPIYREWVSEGQHKQSMERLNKLAELAEGRFGLSQERVSMAESKYKPVYDFRYTGEGYPNPDAIKSFNKLATTTNNISRNLDHYSDLLQHVSNSAVLPDERRALIEPYAVDLSNRLRVAEDAGVLRSFDIDYFKNLLGDPTSVKQAIANNLIDANYLNTRAQVLKYLVNERAKNAADAAGLVSDSKMFEVPLPNIPGVTNKLISFKNKIHQESQAPAAPPVKTNVKISEPLPPTPANAEKVSNNTSEGIDPNKNYLVSDGKHKNIPATGKWLIDKIDKNPGWDAKWVEAK